MPELSFDSKKKNLASLCEKKSIVLRAWISEYCDTAEITVNEFAKEVGGNTIKIQSFLKGLIDITSLEFGELMRILIYLNKSNDLPQTLYNMSITGLL